MSIRKESRAGVAETSCVEPNIYELPSRRNVSQRSGRGSQRRSEKRSRPKHVPLAGKLIPLFMLMLLILMIIIVVALFLIYNKPVGKNSSESKKPKKQVFKPAEGNNSCQEFKRNGFTDSGVYKIQKGWNERRNAFSSSHEVYCDMTTDGGGWTLVASVHRNEVGSKCGHQDKWVQFSTPRSSPDGLDDSLWSSKTTEGRITAITRNDYKSPEYYSRNASDVMLWHVPNGVDVTEIDKQAFLKYHTTNGFLTRHGSTLRQLFKNDAKLEQLDNIGLDLKIIDLVRSRITISSIISDWYTYNYDTGTTSYYIRDGGHDMYDTGNQVYFREADNPYKQLYYGQSYTDSKTYHISSAAIQPFTAVASISNLDGYPQKFSIKVESYGKTSLAALTRQSITEYRSGITIRSMAYSVYNDGSRPSKTMLFFCIQKKWSTSNANCVFEPGNTTSNFVSYGFHVEGKIEKAVIGYMLLSRYYSSTRNSYVSSTDVRKLLKKFADLLDYPEVDVRTLHKVQQITAPVSIVKGSISYPGHNVTSGLLQFRAYDEVGYPYAICPGLRVNGKADPAQFCIGSARTPDTKRCGDFSAWETLREHVFENRTTTNGRFVNDLHSTILIFTR